MVKVSRRVLKSSFVTLGIVALVTVLSFALNADINRRREKIEVIQAENALFRLSLEEFGTLRSDGELAAKALETINTALPDRDKLATFPRELEKMAEKYSLGLGFSFGSETLAVDGEAGRIIYDLTVSGEFENILLFLDEFEKHPYYISMDSFNIAKSVNENLESPVDVFVLKTQGEIFTK